jgi:hypothetical protein
MTATRGKDRLRWVLAGVSAVTVVSGAVQAASPGRVLRALGADDGIASRQGFGTVGMFMTVVGGGGLQAMLRAPQQEAAHWAWWTGIQKLGAAAAVSIGVRRRVFRKVALLVALNDLVSGVLAMRWWAGHR